MWEVKQKWKYFLADGRARHSHLLENRWLDKVEWEEGKAGCMDRLDYQDGHHDHAGVIVRVW